MVLMAQLRQSGLVSPGFRPTVATPTHLGGQPPDLALQLVLMVDQLGAGWPWLLPPNLHRRIVDAAAPISLRATVSKENPVYQVDSAVSTVCDGGNDFICDWVYDVTENETLAEALGWVVEKPVKVLFVLVLAYFINRLVRRAIDRAEARMLRDREAKLEERQSEEIGDGRFAAMEIRARQKAIELTLAAEQAKQRAKTLGSILRSTATAIIYTIAILISLSEFDINLGPLIAGAGIAGIALGFGAQSIVKDFLSGFFMLVEDQYAVGDVVDVGEATGLVESISLRTTQIRDVNGTLWHIPNGEILRVGNKSQQWARVVLDVEVAYGTDIELASRVIKETAMQVWEEHLPTATIIEEPEIWGVEMFGESSIAIRLVAKVEPGEQWMTGRVIRGRLVEAFAREGIEIPFPQRVVWMRDGNEPESPSSS
jgi:small conductance mechanosensitive channel